MHVVSKKQKKREKTGQLIIISSAANRIAGHQYPKIKIFFHSVNNRSIIIFRFFKSALFQVLADAVVLFCRFALHVPQRAMFILSYSNFNILRRLQSHLDLQIGDWCAHANKGHIGHKCANAGQKNKKSQAVNWPFQKNLRSTRQK